MSLPAPIAEFRVEDYVIGRMLGRGGMGTVFEGVHARIGRRAAIKLLDPEASQDARTVARFLNEARAANKIDHPSIVQIYQFGQIPGGPAYIIMEYLEGELLSARIRRCGALGAAAVPLGRQIAAALSAAHRSRVVHRDLKPNNIMLVPDPESRSGERVKVLDFGVAKLDEGGTTDTGVPVGTPSYMAPEQCGPGFEHGPVTDRTDVYGLGLLLYTMLSGAHPFAGARREDLPDLQRRAVPPPLRERAPAVPEALAQLVHGMLAKAPASRPSMDEVARRLAAIEAGQGNDQSPATGALEMPPDGEGTALHVSPASPRRRRLLVAAAGVLIGLGAAALLLRGSAPGGAASLGPPPSIGPGGPGGPRGARGAVGAGPAGSIQPDGPRGAEPAAPAASPADSAAHLAPGAGSAPAGAPMTGPAAAASRRVAPPPRPRRGILPGAAQPKAPSLKYRSDDDIPFMP